MANLWEALLKEQVGASERVEDASLLVSDLGRGASG